MDLIGHIDMVAAELRTDPTETYEVGVGVASAAWWFVGDANVGEAARLISDVFGTWAEVIHTHGHSGGSTEAEVLQAHDQIEAAVADWSASGREDPVAFGRRWRATLDRVYAPWLEEFTLNTAAE
ncbi:hypothetical protein [Nocardioides perillae]|uniref:Uncharacterized protein n=1 Tax=Nocardioides perillae TaxID=1119534 RepID=A0A7Y9RUS8_9ACTN|nr:hypothetical protein [Nocardioides perillae]NYG55726.1 hypothetical protein [Nocardioides perillae]